MNPPAESFIPAGLTALCYTLCTLFFRRHPMRARFDWLRDDIPVLLQLPGAVQCMRSCNAGMWLLFACVGLSLLLAGTALLWNAWSLVGSIGFMGLAWWVRQRNMRCVRFLVCQLLALDFLVSDYAGWGAAFPKAQLKARTLRGEQAMAAVHTPWLDRVLPNRQALTLEQVEELSPASNA